MHIAVGKHSSTLRAILTTLILGASTITNASYIKHDLLSYSNDRINNICFQKYIRTSSTYGLRSIDQNWRQIALSTCQLSSKEVKESFSKKFN